MPDVAESFETALLQCPPLRDAVYRNQTPDRGLRHAVSLGCLPFSTFAAVGPWLPPWNIIPPAEACAKVEALHINARDSSHQQSAALLVQVAEVICQAVTEAPTVPGSPVPFSKVTSLEINFTSMKDYGVDVPRYDHAVHRIVQSLPAIQHLHLPKAFYFHCLQRQAAHGLWKTDLFGSNTDESLMGAEDIAAFRRLPKLTSIDLSNSDINMTGAFFTSPLLCRGTVKRLTWNVAHAVRCLITLDARPARFVTDLHVRLASEAPTRASKALEPTDAWCRIEVPHVPVHWTLETFAMHNSEVNVPMTDLQLLVLMCPRLKEITIASQTWRGDERMSNGWSWRRVVLDADGAAPVIVEDSKHCGVSEYVCTSPILLEAGIMAHRFVKELLKAREQNPTLLHQRHTKALDRITSDRTYPAALLWALGRGREHTTLTTLRLRGTPSDEDADEVAAVVVLATRLRRKSRGGNHR